MLGRDSALGSASAAVTHSLIKRTTETPSITVLFATSLVEWEVSTLGSTGQSSRHGRLHSGRGAFAVQCPQHKRREHRPKHKNGLHAANHGTVRNRLLINPKLYCTAPQTADLVAMATCYFSWAINIFFLHGFTGSMKTRRKFKLITLEQ
jgi:hypothetical protein